MLVKVIDIHDKTGVSVNRIQHAIRRPDFPKHKTTAKNKYGVEARLFDFNEVLAYFSENGIYSKDEDEDFVYVHQPTIVNTYVKTFLKILDNSISVELYAKSLTS
jgi:hypothetical protein